MPRKRTPTYLLHRPTGQARCRINGKDHYLGTYGSPESRERYEQLIAEWFTHGDTSRLNLTIDDLAILFLEFAEKYYRRKDGEPTGSARNIRDAMRPLIRLFGQTRVREFGPVKLKLVRDEMIREGRVRTNINREIHRIKRVFKWGVENELVPAPIYQALATVASLKCGRSDAVESSPVEPVAETVVTETIRYLPRVVAAMVQLQLLSGARPGEICVLRPCDVTFQPNGVWVYRPQHHKSEHHGKQRRIFIGPEGQAVLRPFLDRDAEAYCFSPAESEAERNAEKRANRKTPMTPSQAVRQPKQSRQRAPAERYAKDAYCRAIVRACRLAEVEPWSPGQLRHTRATAIRERYGLEAAATVLGHSDPRVTEIYAERDFEMAARIMCEVG